MSPRVTQLWQYQVCTDLISFFLLFPIPSFDEFSNKRFTHTKINVYVYMYVSVYVYIHTDIYYLIKFGSSVGKFNQLG